MSNSRVAMGIGDGKMFSESLIKKIFSSANLQRWNDHIRPVELSEIDKQSHKMIIAYLIGKYQEDFGDEVRWKELIEGSIFELLHRIVLTDLKPSVFYMIMEEKKEEINSWVFDQLDVHIKKIGGGFKEKFLRYFSEKDYLKKEKNILKTAHYLSTYYEFKLIYEFNKCIYGIEKTKEEIIDKRDKHCKLEGAKEILSNRNVYDFLNLCGQLRFQNRWAQSPRVPKTSVLGHMYMVAVISYFCSVENSFCDKRLYNNFFVSLFHDLPEVLTRDIVSPVKSSVEGLDDIIKEYEKKQMESIIYPLLPDFIKGEIEYFTQDEFKNRVLVDGKIVEDISCEEISEKYNENIYNPVDGKLLKVCDHLTAFMEAKMSISYGIRSEQLEDGIIRLNERYKSFEMLNLDFGKIFGYFN